MCREHFFHGHGPLYGAACRLQRRRVHGLRGCWRCCDRQGLRRRLRHRQCRGGRPAGVRRNDCCHLRLAGWRHLLRAGAGYVPRMQACTRKRCQHKAGSPAQRDHLAEILCAAGSGRYLCTIPNNGNGTCKTAVRAVTCEVKRVAVHGCASESGGRCLTQAVPVKRHLLLYGCYYKVRSAVGLPGNTDKGGEGGPRKRYGAAIDTVRRARSIAGR
jgi:hypothetical protein